MEVTPTQFRRSVTKDTVDTTKEAAAPVSKGNCTNAPQQPSIMRTLVKLSEEQTKGLNFPLGCPVWYNFSQSSCFSGVVQTVHLDIVQKKLVYTVSRKNSHSKSDTNDKQSLVLDTVSEDDLSYAFNCPVTLTSKSDDAGGDDGDDVSSNKKMAGEIMFAENVEDEMLYVVKLIPSEDEEGVESHIIRFEDGVKASRLRYREEVVAKALPSKHQQHCEVVKKDCGHASNVGVEKVEAVSSSEEEHSLEEKLVVQQRPNQALNVGDRAVSKEQCSSKKKKPQVKVPNKKKAEIKYKPRNNNHKNSYYGPSMNSKAKFPRRNSRDEFGRMPRKKKEGNKSRGGPKKNAGQDH